MHRSIECLSGKGFLMDAAIRGAVEQAADFVLEFLNNPRRIFNQCPRQLLVVQKRAAFHRVLEMRLNRIVWIEHDVVTPLDHSRAAAFAEHSFGDERYVQRGFAPESVKCSHQTRAAGAKDEKVSSQLLRHSGSRTENF